MSKIIKTFDLVPKKTIWFSAKINKNFCSSGSI
jgi:hypothetical protein